MTLICCSSCGKLLPHTVRFFKPSRGCKNGLTRTCRDCRNQHCTAWKRKNSDKLAKRRRALYAGKHGEHTKAKERERKESFPVRTTAQRLFSGVYERSKIRGEEREEKLKSSSFFETWLRNQPCCPCCGVRFDLSIKGGVKNDASPSIDRFDNNRGYTLDNMKLICWRCNNIKRNYSSEDLKMVARWIEKETFEEDDLIG